MNKTEQAWSDHLENIIDSINKEAKDGNYVESIDKTSTAYFINWFSIDKPSKKSLLERQTEATEKIAGNYPRWIIDKELKLIINNDEGYDMTVEQFDKLNKHLGGDWALIN